MPATVQLDVLLEGQKAVAEAAKVDTAVDQIGKQAGSASQVATRAFNGYEKAAAGAGAATARTASDVGQLLVKQQQLASESSRLTQGINLLERAMARAPEQANIFSERMQELLVRKRAVGEEASVLKDTLGSLGETTGKVTEKTEGAATGFSRVTQQVRTSGSGHG